MNLERRPRNVIRDPSRGPREGVGISLSPSQDPAMVYLARLAPGSRRTMAGALRAIIEIGGGNGAQHNVRSLTDSRHHFGKPDGTPLGYPVASQKGLVVAFPWWKLQYQHCQAIRSALAARYAPATANKMISALKGVLKESWRLGYMDAESYHRAVDLAPVRGTSTPRGRALNRDELDRVFDVCRDDPAPIGRRDLALFSVLYGAGLRRQEVTSLQVEDYDPTSGRLVVHGKGNKTRTVYIKNGQKRALENWLEIRGLVDQAARGEECHEAAVVMNAAAPGFSPIFLGTGGRGRAFTTKGMSVDAVYDVCQSRAEQAGIKPFSPHDLRRTAISDMLDAGADISAVKSVAGHALIETTSRYDRRGERAKEAAACLLRI